MQRLPTGGGEMEPLRARPRRPLPEGRGANGIEERAREDRLQSANPSQSCQGNAYERAARRAFRITATSIAS